MPGGEHEAVAVRPVGRVGSIFMKRVNSTVATSAMPIGMPGWPDFACLDRVHGERAQGIRHLAIGDLGRTPSTGQRTGTVVSGQHGFLLPFHAARRLRSTRSRIIGVRMSCIARSSLPPGMTMEFARDIQLSWIIESR